MLTNYILYIMKLIIFLMYTPLVYTELHTLMTTYTGVKGSKGIPKFFAISTLDGQQLDYYDSITQTLINKQKWLEKHASTEMWKKESAIRRTEQDNFNNTIYKLMGQFNQSDGIYTYQRMYGCSWDSENNESDGFDMYGFDGEDFITLDLNRGTYIPHTPQAQKLVQKWSKDVQKGFLLYLKYECLYWLNTFLDFANGTLNKTVLPKVSLLQKNFDHVVCHATGFCPKNATITWRKNGEELHPHLVKLGEHLPNEDGTFQINVTLNVNPEDWKRDQYVCVVEHKSWTKKIRKILIEKEIKRNNNSGAPIYIIPICLAIIVAVAVFVLLAHYYYTKQTITTQKNKQHYAKIQPSPQQKEINLQIGLTHS